MLAISSLRSLRSAAGQTTDHHVRCERDRVRTLAGPHPCRFGHEAGLVTVLETGPDLVGATDDDLAELVQRLVALHPCRTASNHQHSHLLHGAVTPLRRHRRRDRTARAAGSASIGSDFPTGDELAGSAGPPPPPRPPRCGGAGQADPYDPVPSTQTFTTGPNPANQSAKQPIAGPQLTSRGVVYVGAGSVTR